MILRNYPELFTETIFFIGNGSSRKDFDLNYLEGKGTIIGCNALYRDFEPDILICQDAKMARELHESNYTGLVLSGRGIGVRLKNHVTYRAGDTRTSGAFGLNFIVKVMKPKKCYVFGLDGFPGNIYKHTRNYAKSIQKFDKIIPQYRRVLGGKTKIINVNLIDTWNAQDNSNYEFITYSEFLNRN